jgi:hypothetical protein
LRTGRRGEYFKLRKWKYLILYSLNNFKEIKSRRIRPAGHVTRIENVRNMYKISVGKSEWELENLGVDVR